jgi:methylated-DNA-[protein]-cysteine S-methyltransferase
MKQGAYCLFETQLGWCGIAWRESADLGIPVAVTSFQLPEASKEMTEARIAQSPGMPKPASAPSQILMIISKVQLHLQGEVQDFADVHVDLGGVEHFDQQVYEAVHRIPAGKTATYGEVAEAMGQPAASRAVGRALAHNPIPLIIPCHRVVAAAGKLGGFSAHGGRVTKAKLLAIEGATVNLRLDLTAKR